MNPTSPSPDAGRRSRSIPGGHVAKCPQGVPANPDDMISHREGDRRGKSSPRPKRRRGGQPGNDNAFRHGLYSKYFTVAELKNLDENIDGEFDDELAFARTQLARLARKLEDPESMSDIEYVATSRAASEYLDRIIRLKRAQKVLFHSQTTLAQALAELAAIPPEED
jgi:hypothetical protein